jgi:head-tail adaptor
VPDNPSGQLPASNGIGSLRWRVTLYRRHQGPGPNSGISDTFVPICAVHADVQPTYPSTFYNSAAIDTPVSHLIRMRWQDYVENTHIIMRSTDRPTDGTMRTELFRVRRLKEIAGRKRFAEFECELERSLTTTDDSDAERELLFAENAADQTRWDLGQTGWDNGRTMWPT